MLLRLPSVVSKEVSGQKSYRLHCLARARERQVNSPGALASLIQLGIEWSAGLTRRGPHLGTTTKDTSPYNKHANTRVANMFRHSWFCVSFFLFFLVFAAKRRRDPAKIIWRCIVCFVSRLWKRRGPRHWRDPGPVLDQMRKCADSGRPGKKPTLVDKVAGKRRPGNEKKRSVAVVS